MKLNRYSTGESAAQPSMEDILAGPEGSIVLAASRTLRSTCFFQPSPADSKAFEEWLKLNIPPQSRNTLD